MKKKILIYVIMILILFSGSIIKGHTQNADMVIKRSNLHYNEKYIIVYGSGAKLSDSSRVEALIYRDLLQEPDRVKMAKSRTEWKAEYILTDTSTKMILLAFQALDDSGNAYPESIDDNEGKYWSVQVYNKEERPVRGANLTEALSYTGLGDLRETDLEKALEYIEEELSLYPDNYAALKLKYSILFRNYEYKSYIREKIDTEVTELLNKDPDNKKRLNFAYEMYRMIGNRDKAEEIEKRIVDLDPGGDRAAGQRLSKIMKIENASVKLDSLELFLEEFPNTRFTEIVLSGITTAAIELENIDKMKKVGDILLRTAQQPSGAGSLAGIAGVLSEKGEDLKRAVEYAAKAVDLAQSFSRREAPPGITEDDWQEHNRRLKARYQDILGWALYQYGEPEKALGILEEAAGFLPQSSTYFHYGTVLLKQEGAGIAYEEPDSQKVALTQPQGLKKAMEYLAGAVAFGGVKGDQAYELLQTVWNRTQPDTTGIDSFIQDQTDKIEKEFKEKILAKRDIRPAPDFDLEDLKGDWVKLSDQEGVVIVLGFWATWSKSSLKMLSELVELADVYGDSVLFITISTDFDWRRAVDFVRKTRFPLPVLLNEETDKNYGLQGVPAVFVIDKELNIHFEHKGYTENIKEILAIEIESLLQQ